MKNQTIVIASIIGVGVLAFLGYKWYNKKKNASINESIVRNVDKNIEAIKKKKLATKQEGAIMGGLEENPFKKNKDIKLSEPLKYTAAKLYEKGVILEIEGIQTNQ